METPPPVPQLPAARCRQCAYCIENLPSPGTCPECGSFFDLARPATYTRKPPFLAWRFWLPGLVLASVIGILGLAIGAFGFGAWGWSLWLATPTAMGSILGYRLRTGPIWTVLAAIALVGTFGLGVLSLGLGGVFCGMILSVIVLGPIAFGVVCGLLLRVFLKNSSFQQRSYLPVILIILMLLPCYALDHPGPSSVETVTTTAIFDVPASVAYDSIVFYEQVTHPPPWILRIGLVRPLSTTGTARAVGDVKVCLYNKGRIVKRITQAEPASVLAFEVTEQQIGYERDIKLTGGSFEFIALGPSRTLVRLSTSYYPLLHPRWCWKWGEAIGIHALHRHVLEGMKLRACLDDRVLAYSEADR